MKNHKILDHPIVAMILLMSWGAFFYQTVGVIFKRALGDDFTGYGAAVGAVIALIIHKVWFLPEFKGAVGIPKIRKKDTGCVFLIFAVMIIAMDLFSFIGHEVAFTLSGLGVALMAGLGEEMFIRVLPISVMMRDWMDEKHIIFISYSTAVIFGIIHFMNIGGGASLEITLIQVLSATGIGVMFAAFYLRTGNILLCMILHTVHDMLALMLVGTTDNMGIVKNLSTFDAITSIIIGVVGLILGTFLIRKSVRSDIVEVWKERWVRQ